MREYAQAIKNLTIAQGLDPSDATLTVLIAQAQTLQNERIARLTKAQHLVEQGKHEAASGDFALAISRYNAALAVQVLPDDEQRDIAGEGPNTEANFVFATEIQQLKLTATKLAQEELEDNAKIHTEMRQRAMALREQAEDSLRHSEGGSTHYHAAKVALEEGLELLRSLGTEPNAEDMQNMRQMERELEAANAGLAAEARVLELLTSAAQQMHDYRWDDALASLETARDASNWEHPLRILLDELAAVRKAAHAGEMGRRLQKLGAKVGKLTVRRAMQLYLYVHKAIVSTSCLAYC